MVFWSVSGQGDVAQAEGRTQRVSARETIRNPGCRSRAHEGHDQKNKARPTLEKEEALHPFAEHKVKWNGNL